MGFLKTTWDQILELFQKMPASQQAMFFLVLVLIGGGFGMLVWNSSKPVNSYVPLSVGKLFTVEEIIHAEEALQQAGLQDYKREGQRLYVPRDEVESYNSALIASGTLPQNWAEEWEKQYADLGPFANNKQMMDRKEIARAKLASQMISAITEIDSANVVWDQQETRRWPHEPRSSATVFIRPKRGRKLTRQVVDGIRVSISGMKADLVSENVTVFDLSTGIAHKSEDDSDPLGNTIIKRITQLQDMYRNQILTAVDYIPNVRVAVNVDIDKVRSAIRKKQEIQTKGSVAIISTETKKDRTFSQAPVQSEPGQNANGGLDLNKANGNQRNEQITESDNSQVTVPTFEVTQEDLLGAMPQNVQVSLVVPEDYYLAVGQKTGEIAADTDAASLQQLIVTIKTRVNAELKTRVAKIIPYAGTGNPEDGVDVGSYVRLDDPLANEATAPGLVENATWAINQWGSATLLVLFALWGLMMLSRTMKESAKNTPPLPEITPIVQAEREESEDDDVEGVEMPETTSREQLQKVVRNNPDIAANIINKWMKDS